MNRAKDRHSISRGMRRSFLVCLAGLALSVLSASLVQAGTIFVDDSAPPLGDGASWATAYTNLQFALQTASSVGDEIRVAAGTYRPTSGTDRTATFQLKNGVALYGGYPSGGGPRDWKNNETILSGDIGTQGVNTDNSYHVVTGSGTDASTVLDGFTVSGGNAAYGGGMYNSGGSPTVTNCTFSGNQATNCGGGMYNSGSPTVANCTFSDNKVTTENGGGMYNVGGSPTVISCTFSGNQATAGAGGGMYNLYVNDYSPTVTNCTFFNNSANVGGGMGNSNCVLMPVTNCTFFNNSANDTGGGMWHLGRRSVVKNTILAGNTPDDCGGLTPNSDGYNLERGTSCDCIATTDQRNTDPLLDPFLKDNGGPTMTHALLPGSPAIDAIPPPYNGAPPTDQRGVARPQPVGGYCDIGAVEMELAYAKGDVNGDGAIDLLDVRLCLQIAQGIITGTVQQHAAADVDSDGDVDMDDAQILAEFIIGMRTTLP